MNDILTSYLNWPKSAGGMQSWPMTLDKLLTSAAANHQNAKVVSRHVDGSTHRTRYANTLHLAQRFSSALKSFGICQGDRVGTLLWNNDVHLAS